MTFARRGTQRCLAIALATWATGCSNGRSTDEHLERILPAGPTATVFDVTGDAFSLPAPALTEEHRSEFFVGNSFFNQNWVAAPASVTSRDGLGPLFNARSCSGCHFKDGRGHPPEANEAPVSMLVRISVAAEGPHGAPAAHPVYGDQLQDHAIGRVPPEVDVRIDYEDIKGNYDDGEPYSLRRPHVRLERWGYGPPNSELRLSTRVAPARMGLGLLEAVPESDLRALEDPEDRDHDGISGRSNQVWDGASQSLRRGRFGWKAEQPSLSAQIAAALQGDMGITSAARPTENHTPAETPCAEQPSGGTPEIDPPTFHAILLYARALGVPARRAVTAAAGAPAQARSDAGRGRSLFERSACGRCHTETLRTEPVAELPELGRPVLHPYTDLLLHDLGPGLDDGRPVFDARGAEWRTPPLWGLGLVQQVNGHTLLLHDGRARGVAEAILWHDGEAKASRDAFVHMSKADRDALMNFVLSL